MPYIGFSLKKIGENGFSSSLFGAWSQNGTHLLRRGLSTHFIKIFQRLKRFFYPFVLGVLTWIIIFSQIYIIALSLGINVPYHLFLVVYPIANVISFIPITSSGFGTREAAVVFLLGLLNVPSEKALVLSLVGFIITDFLTGLYGFTLALSEMRNKKIKNARDELKKLVY